MGVYLSYFGSWVWVVEQAQNATFQKSFFIWKSRLGIKIQRTNQLLLNGETNSAQKCKRIIGKSLTLRKTLFSHFLSTRTKIQKNDYRFLLQCLVKCLFNIFVIRNAAFQKSIFRLIEDFIKSKLTQRDSLFEFNRIKRKNICEYSIQKELFIWKKSNFVYLCNIFQSSKNSKQQNFNPVGNEIKSELANVSKEVSFVEFWFQN